MARWLDRLKVSPEDTARWILEKACPSVQLRTLTSVLGRPAEDPEVVRAREGAANFKPAVTIARAQDETGTWLSKVLEFEVPNASRKRGPGMVNQYLALVDYGWDGTHPIIHCTQELLNRYLVEDPHVDLYELRGYAGSNPEIDAGLRWLMSFISGALLSRSGYTEDPALAERAQRLLAELEDQYPESGPPDLYDGIIEIEEQGSFRRVRERHLIPDMFLFYFLAWHPRFKEDDARPVVARVVDQLMAPDDCRRRIFECQGKRYLKVSDLTIGAWDQKDYAEGRVGYLLHDLELLARTGMLERVPKAVALLEWLLSLQNVEDGAFRLDNLIEKAVTRSQYSYFPLEDSWRGRHKKYTDVTFRILLILKILDEGGKGG